MSKTLENDASRVPANGHAYRISPIGMTSFVLALVALGTTLPGRYVADARFELYWGTSKYLGRHLSLWDSVRNLGRPSPYFSPVIGGYVGLLRALGLSPAWAERTLHATMIALGAAGAAAMYRHFTTRQSLNGTGPTVIFEGRSGIFGAWCAGLIYAFAPYVSEFLVPSGLFAHYALTPWLIYAFLGGTELENRWKFASMFALCVFSMGAVNPASLAYSLLPIVPVAIGSVFILRTTTAERIAQWTWRAALLSAMCASAAIVSVSANLPVLDANLDTTELPRTVASFSSWGESLRGMGSWLSYFLGGGATASNPSPFINNQLAVAASWIVPIAAVVSLWRLRLRIRLVFGLMMATSVVIMVGMFPPDGSAPIGRAINFVFESVPITRSMRNGYKAGSGLVLAQALLVAVGVTMLRSWISRRNDASVQGTATRQRRPLSVAIGVTAIIAIFAAATPFWTGEVYAPRETVTAVPGYWQKAFTAVNALPDDGRVLILPGTNRARYRWGYVGDDILDALMTQPHASSCALPQSTPRPAGPWSVRSALPPSRSQRRLPAR